MEGEEREAKTPYSDARQEQKGLDSWAMLAKSVGLLGYGQDRGTPGESLVWAKIVRVV